MSLQCFTLAGWRAMRRERICTEITNPLEIYDDFELIE